MWRIPFFGGDGVRCRKLEWEVRRLVDGTEGGSFVGEAAREEARLDATMALARESPDLRGVIRRGCSW